MTRWATFLLVAVALAGCTATRDGGGDSPQPPATRSSPVPSGASASPESTGPVDLREPLELAGVVPAGGPPRPASVLPDPDGTDLPLAEPFLTVTRLEDAALQFQEYDGSWAVLLEMTEPDATTLAGWTSEHVGERVAIVANGRVISAPAIQGAIDDGFVVISARYTERQARDLLAQLAGR